MSRLAANAHGAHQVKCHRSRTQGAGCNAVGSPRRMTAFETAFADADVADAVVTKCHA